MDIESRIGRIMKETLEKIQEFARKGDLEGVATAGRTIEQVRILEGKLNEVTEALNSIEKLAISNSSSYLKLPTASSVSSVSGTSSQLGHRIPTGKKERGKMRRAEFLERLRARGINLEPESGRMFRSSGNRRIGVAYAYENKPDRWWLGLEEKDYKALVLLCESESGKVIEFVLPEAFFQKHRTLFSRSGRELKFNIARSGSLYQMILRSEKIGINEYIGKVENIG